jgi:hypothetical protein
MEMTTMTDFSEPTTATGSTWIRCYSPDGYQMAVTLPVTSVADALRHLADIRAAGLTATLPVAGGLDDGESADTITTVVRREKENKHGNLVSIIDCYWEGAEYSFATIYLDEPAQIAEFELHSGQRVNDMPVYESDNAKRLDATKPSRYERKCTPFVAVRKKADKEVKVKGEMVRPWRFVRYGTLATQAPAPVTAAPKAEQTPPPPSTPSPDGMGFTRDTAFEFVSHWFKKETLSTESILKALGIEAFGDWKQSVADAHARVALVVQALKGHDAPADAPLAGNGQRRH